MSINDRDDRLEELLRSSLHGEADMITPGGDGLSRIQHRVNARRAHVGWLRPVAIAGSSVAVVAAGLGAYLITQNSGPKQDTSVIGPATPSPGATSSSAPPPVAAPVFPVAGFYPFTTSTAEKDWEGNGGPTKNPTYLKPDTLALTFASAFLQQPTLDQVMSTKTHGKQSQVTLGRNFTDGSNQSVQSVTTVDLEKFGQAWIVVGADDAKANLRLTTPTRGATIFSPQVVSGPAYGVDEAVIIEVRSLTGKVSSGSGGHASFGNGTGQWSTTVSFTTPNDPAGAVVVLEPSAADGGPGRIAVSAVRFAGNKAAVPPAYFYGVKNNRITKFASRNGASVQYLTDPPLSGQTVTDPQLVAGQVYFVANSATCGSVIQRVPTSGGAPSMVRASDADYRVNGYAVTSDGAKLTMSETSCITAPGRLQGKLVTRVLGTNTTHTIAFPSFPPLPVADPTWEADGQHIDVIVRTGTQSGLQSYDALAAKSWSDSTSACSGFDANNGQLGAVASDGSGQLWFAVQTGSSMEGLRCVGGQPQVMFTINGNDTPQDLSISTDGTAAILTDVNGHVWRWSSGGQPQQLTPSVKLDHVAW